jgi:hypothetical protein
MDNISKSDKWMENVRAAVAAPDLPEEFLAGLDARLRSRLRERSARGGAERRLRLAFAAAVLVAAVGLVAIAGPERVLAAFRNALGFIPGIGFVSSDSPVRILAEPVRAEREGITVILAEVLADSDQTKIRYTVEGLPQTITTPSAGDESCPGRSILALPDGRRLTPIGGGGGPLDSEMLWNESFPSLPPQVMDATLIIPCIPLTAAGEFPGNWEISFHLVPADTPARFQTVVPVPSVIPTPSLMEAGVETAPAAAFPGVAIGIDRMTELENGFLLIGILEWDPELYSMADASGSAFTLTDRDGRILPVENAGSVPEEPGRPNSSYWSLMVNGKDLHGPITVTLDSLYVFLRDPLAFSWDAGSRAKLGQVWEIGKTFSISGHPLSVLSAEYIMENNMPGFSVSVRTPPEILHLVVGAQNPPEAGGGPESSLEPGIYRWRVFLQAPPEGRVDLFIQQMTIQGGWTTSWESFQE